MRRVCEASQRPSDLAFAGVSALVFASCAALTIFWCGRMASMGGMRMPGGWTMSMAWMRMPGQTWLEAAAGFIGMWVVMMVAMMLPSLAPALERYRRAAGGAGEARSAWLAAFMAMGYYFIWTLFGIAIYALGVVVAAFEMRQPAMARAAPLAAGVAVLVAGTIQFTRFKAHHLGCCRGAWGQGDTKRADARTAWLDGLCLGLHCSYCCGNLTVIMLAIGVMDLRAMAVVTVLITLERLAPRGDLVAQAAGVAVVGSGLFLISRAAGLV